MLMEKTVLVDMTMHELHKHIQTWRRQNPQVKDVAVALEMAVAERWPGLDPALVCLYAEQNALLSDTQKEIKAAAQNFNEWIDTHAQGDLFNPLPFSVPRKMLKDGKPASYWEMSVVEMAEYLQSSAESTKFQADEFQRLADDKRLRHARIIDSLDRVRQVIALAKKNGIDPETLYCEKPE